ncbi:riboflavin synthase [Fervidobacterium thailandense]|uniref:Riboflavin synthase n=1 Tax=Fervidobacterium thailandense TaxID=1008305 RepID=A0A1E3G105_9BACT|nr:riboflavin synthase [Fervidobacterium thailandense]ODN29905.1 riboflavin synthase subunit alpha [Fervidobacterium thailandense]
MFTGIIQSVQPGNLSGGVLKIKRCWDDLSLGESVAVNGVCLTVRSFDKDFVYFDVGPETIGRSNLSKCKFFNLERALKVGDRISGHFVTGHVDGVIRFLSKYVSGNSVFFKFAMPNERYAIVEKGSIALNGISLTIAKVDLDSFIVQVIPHTLEQTNLKYLSVGDPVNYEIDILARYLYGVLKNSNGKGKVEDVKWTAGEW